MSPGGQLSHLLPLPLPPDSIGRQKGCQLTTGIGTPIYHPALGINLHADNVSFDPVRLDGNFMAIGLQGPLHIIRDPAFEP